MGIITCLKSHWDNIQDYNFYASLRKYFHNMATDTPSTSRNNHNLLLPVINVLLPVIERPSIKVARDGAKETPVEEILEAPEGSFMED